MKHRIDLMSKKILAQITRDAGCNPEAVAEAVGCSVEVAKDRIQKLQEDGIVNGFRADVDISHLTGHHEALVVGVPSHETDANALDRLSQEDDVSRVFTMASQASVAFHVHGKTTEAVEERATELAKQIGLAAHRTTMIVSNLGRNNEALVHAITN